MSSDEIKRLRAELDNHAEVVTAAVIAAPMLMELRLGQLEQMGINPRTGRPFKEGEQQGNARDKVRSVLHSAVWVTRELRRISELPDHKLEEL